MAVLVAGKVLLDTNIFIDYLRAGRYATWVWGGSQSRIRFLSAVVLLELRLGADTASRIRSVGRIHAAFPGDRVVAPAPDLFGWAGMLFRALHGSGLGLQDRLGPINDLLIALTAWRIGATVVTRNIGDFKRIADHLPGLVVVDPVEQPE